VSNTPTNTELITSIANRISNVLNLLHQNDDFNEENGPVGAELYLHLIVLIKQVSEKNRGPLIEALKTHGYGLSYKASIGTREGIDILHLTSGHSVFPD
jgi:hypothetical protein